MLLLQSKRDTAIPSSITKTNMVGRNVPFLKKFYFQIAFTNGQCLFLFQGFMWLDS